jgi:phage tail-like protein
VLAPGVAEAVVYSWREGALTAAGDVYPLREHDGGPFLHGPAGSLEYPSRRPTAVLPNRIAPRPLVAIALPALARHANGTLAAPLDSGTTDTAWHRLYVEAQIPLGTGFTLYAAATDSDLPSAAPEPDDWQPHHFGAVPAGSRHEPRAAWMSAGSEIPGHAGFSNDTPQRDRSGHFTVLLQRSNRPVRTLRGRFLHLRVTLRGNLRATPCLHAVRAYGPRFSYQDKYLPALYRESLFGPDADRLSPDQPSTRPDFLGRFLANFEGILTPLEDKVAASWLLTDPQRTSEDAVEWLGSWIGVGFAPWYPVQHRRRHLQQAPELFRRRGTLRGLQLALDIATGNAVTAGRIVVVEDWWFRRTLQTVLGVKLDRDHDPLLGGSFTSGNSKVGNTLFLSEEGTEKKFLALFDASIRLKAADQATVDAFFASLAHRVTVLVHESAGPDEFALIERLCAAEAPAHVITRVRPASADFMVGLTALLSVDTYLRPHPVPPAVEVDTSALGDGSLLRRPPSLDPRLEGASR